MNSVTLDFYLYGVLDKITAILDVLNIAYKVETTTNYTINFKRLTVENKHDIITIITLCSDFLTGD